MGAGPCSDRVGELLAALADGDALRRRQAAQDLGELGDVAAVPGLIAALADPVVAVRESAVDGLVAVAMPEVAWQVATLLDSQDAALRNYGQEILEGLGTASVEALMERLVSPSSDVRKFAVDVLGRIGEVSEIRATGILCGMLGDANPNVAGAAAEALGRVGDKRALPALVQHLRGEPWLQCCVLYAIARIGGEAALAALADIDSQSLLPEVAHYFVMAKHILEQRQD